MKNLERETRIRKKKLSVKKIIGKRRTRNKAKRNAVRFWWNSGNGKEIHNEIFVWEIWRKNQ